MLQLRPGVAKLKKKKKKELCCLAHNVEKEMATHSSIAWKIPWTEEPWQATVHGVAKSQTRLSDFTSS